MTIAEVLGRDARTAHVFLKHRMACVGCTIAPFETLAVAAGVYRIAIDELLAELAAVSSAGGTS